MKEPYRPCTKCGGTAFTVQPEVPGSRAFLFDCIQCGQGKFVIQPKDESDGRVAS